LFREARFTVSHTESARASLRDVVVAKTMAPLHGVNQAQRAVIAVRLTEMDAMTLFENSNLYAMKTIAARLGVSRSTVQRWIQDRGFPRAIALSPGRVAWHGRVLNEWLASREPAVLGPRPAEPDTEHAAAAG
jgi:predicted DNA-binding transcriptional regulator AlpA